MRRRQFIRALGGAVAIAAWPPAAHGQDAGLRKIGVLWHAASAEEEAVYLGALREGLAGLGHIEGRNIILENRFPAENAERFVSLAAELAQLKPDVLVAVSRPAAWPPSAQPPPYRLSSPSFPIPLATSLSKVWRGRAET